MKKKVSRPRPAATKKRAAPENKDNLDSRKNEEQEFKGDDITHNKKTGKNKRAEKEE